MRAKPSTDEPSNHTPSSSAPSNPPTGISTLFTAPVTSVNCREMNLTPSSLTCLTRSFASILFSYELFDYQYFTKVERIPENRGAGAAGPAPLFSGFFWSFRDLLIIDFQLLDADRECVNRINRRRRRRPAVVLS